jgi:hypothetical protein
MSPWLASLVFTDVLHLRDTIQTNFFARERTLPTIQRHNLVRAARTARNPVRRVASARLQATEAGAVAAPAAMLEPRARAPKDLCSRLMTESPR